MNLTAQTSHFKCALTRMMDFRFKARSKHLNLREIFIQALLAVYLRKDLTGGLFPICFHTGTGNAKDQ